MDIKQGLVRARSHLIFLVGLLSAFALVIWLEGVSMQSRENDLFTQLVAPSEDRVTPKVKGLTPEEMQWAKTAWKYFENNTIPETGLVNSVDQYTASTLWDTSSYLMALIAAQRLQLISQAEFDARVSKLLGSLERLPLFDGKLPNKSYNTQSLAMVDYNNQATDKGIGWSAIDIGRVLVPFNILVWQHPQHTFGVEKVLARWDMKSVLKEGEMQGATVNAKGKVEYPQEGRLGYEEYAAKSFSLMGLDVSVALDYLKNLKLVDIYGIPVATDDRDPLIYQAHNYVVSEPYILDGVEFGWDRVSREFAWRVYRVQEERYKETGVLTAVSEDNIDQAPYFVYNTVYTGGKTWNAITDDGKDAAKFKTLSTKAVFGWHMLYDTGYTGKLMDKVATAFDPARGWYSGIYEVGGKPNKAITANTNGIILEALAFRQGGPLVQIGRKD